MIIIYYHYNWLSLLILIISEYLKNGKLLTEWLTHWVTTWNQEALAHLKSEINEEVAIIFLKGAIAMAQNIVRYKQRLHRTKFPKVTQGSKSVVYSVYIFQWCKQPCDRKREWQNEQMGEQWFWTVSSAGITYHIFLYLISNACISFAKKRLNETIKISTSWNSFQAVVESFQAVNKETTSCLPAANHLFFSCQDVSNGVKTQHL